MKIIIRLYRHNRVIKRLIGNRDNWRKLYARLASAVSERYLVRVEYGSGITNKETTEMFYNEYEGESLIEAKQALKAFLEQ